MPNQEIQEPKSQEANMPPKKMTNPEIWLKIVADQKIIREALEKGVSLKELEETHGFRFARL
jgi:hypothetical protein